MFNHGFEKFQSNHKINNLEKFHNVLKLLRKSFKIRKSFKKFLKYPNIGNWIKQGKITFTRSRDASHYRGLKTQEIPHVMSGVVNIDAS